VTDCLRSAQYTSEVTVCRPPRRELQVRLGRASATSMSSSSTTSTGRFAGWAPLPVIWKDAVHDVFVVVHRRLDDYDPTRPLRPWLFGIAFRVASERRRRPVEMAGREEEMLAVADLRPTPEARLASEEARRRVHAALDTLPLDQRAVLVMHDLEGHSAPEVAVGLDVGLNTVYSRLRLAREKFVIALRAVGPE
jgi:RNA polymerase sigma-70 factor (ECF subfamily)